MRIWFTPPEDREGDEARRWFRKRELADVYAGRIRYPMEDIALAPTYCDECDNPAWGKNGSRFSPVLCRECKKKRSNKGKPGFE